MSIVVTTPTGHIGSVVVRKLIEAGADMRVIARDPNRLDGSVRERVAVFTGDMFDAEVTRKATEGAEVLFWLTPPDMQTPNWRAYYERSAEVVSAAVRENRIPYVVHLSSAGADHPQGWGPVSLLYLVEKALVETGANVLQLRPGYFYENLLFQIEPIKAANSLFMPVPPETRYPMLATRDIGEVAAQRLLAKDFRGEEILGLHGPAVQPTFGEVAEILGEVLGKPLSYVEIPVEQAKAQMRQMGASESVATNYAELYEALIRGEQPTEPRTPETTTPTTLREWAQQVMRPMVI
ncbi:MAG: NAD(P)H-binding protein [Armatimonadaceae bacterium]